MIDLDAETCNNLAYLVGALADGSIYSNKKHYVYRISYYQKSQEYLTKCIEPIIFKLFQKRGRLYLDKRKGVYFYEITSKYIYNFFLDKIEKFKDKNERRVPLWIKNGVKTIQQSFIRGFFEADGYYHLKPKNSDYRVRLGQYEYFILKDIREMLKDDFKCSDVLGPYQSKPNVKPYYELHIHGIKQVNKFHKIIKPCHLNKQL